MKKLYTLVGVMIAVFMVVVIVQFKNYRTAVQNNDHDTLEFLTAGGYSEECYPFFTVEIAGPEGTVLVNYEEDKIVGIYISYPMDNGEMVQTSYSGWETAKCRVFSVNWGSDSLPQIYDVLVKEYGFTAYKVYKTI